MQMAAIKVLIAMAAEFTGRSSLVFLVLSSFATTWISIYHVLPSSWVNRPCSSVEAFNDFRGAIFAMAALSNVVKLVWTVQGSHSTLERDPTSVIWVSWSFISFIVFPALMCLRYPSKSNSIEFRVRFRTNCVGSRIHALWAVLSNKCTARSEPSRDPATVAALLQDLDSHCIVELFHDDGANGANDSTCGMTSLLRSNISLPTSSESHMLDGSEPDGPSPSDGRADCMSSLAKNASIIDQEFLKIEEFINGTLADGDDCKIYGAFMSLDDQELITRTQDLIELDVSDHQAVLMSCTSLDKWYGPRQSNVAVFQGPDGPQCCDFTATAYSPARDSFAVTTINTQSHFVTL